MKRRLAAAACGLGAAGAALCLGLLAADMHSAARLARASAAHAGAAQGVIAIERDLARLIGALESSAAPDALAARFAGLRAQLGGTLAAEMPTGRLAPQDVELLARFAHDLDVNVARLGAQGEAATQGGLAAAAQAHVGGLADLGERLAAGERAAAATGAEALERVGRGLPLAMLSAGVLAAFLGALGFLLRAPRAAAASPDLRLQAELEAARLAKARFVMMMSHELRTPMNGMLGLLSLMKEYDPPQTMRPLIDQAERAGRQLVAMLGDLLEVEADPAPAAEPPPFRVDDLADSMRAMFGPAADSAGTGFTVSVKGEVPPEATGDGIKFQRALSQVCSQVVEQAGVSDIALELSHTGEECVAELTFAHAAGTGAGLKLVEPAPAPPSSADEFGAPGLGPLLAKGLLEQMGGRLEVSSLDSGRILVLAAAPSQAKEVEAAPATLRPRVRVIAQTRSLGALGAAAAAAGSVDVLSAEDAPAPDVVLVEAGGEEEARALAEARASWPGAMIIALGEPDSADGFDGFVAGPLEPERIARAVEGAWSRAGASMAAGAPLVSPPS
jgi:signal transduction histidine kinase